MGLPLGMIFGYIQGFLEGEEEYGIIYSGSGIKFYFGGWGVKVNGQLVAAFKSLKRGCLSSRDYYSPHRSYFLFGC
jgi:hypothetical protein